MTDEPARRNRLDESASPYLLDHADNPVHWQPWDDIALDAARERDVPIFLSIGYAACHWCHVMADESFEDETVATHLNEQYVPIKVDREEHPDLDQFYQKAIQATSGRGGWPLSAWLTPDGRPFQLATYLPKEPQRGMPGFIEVLDRLANRWEDDREAIEERADEITEAVDSMTGGPRSEGVTTTGDDQLIEVANSLLRSVDHDHGGFSSSGPKFPHPSRLQLLLCAYELTDRDAYRTAVVRTLDAMADGGMYDHVGGGFHRYATDAEWKIPHFEKMLYDNATLLGLYGEAASRLDEDRYRDVVHETADFMTRSMRDGEGGFYSSLDADTEGEEGLTYVWTPDEIEQAVDDPVTEDILIDRFGIDDSDEIAGGVVLRIQTTVDELANTHDLPADEVVEQIETGLDQLRSTRATRPQPRLDTKVITEWNGLAIAGFARAGAFLDDPSLLAVAQKTLEFIESTMYEEDSGQLWRRYRDGEVAIGGFLSDYAAVAVGAFELHWATGSKDAARFGIDLVDAMLDRCWDPTDAELTFAQRDQQRSPIDALDARDQPTPSPVALAVEALATADGFRDDDRTEAVLDHVRSTYDVASGATAVSQAALTTALDRWHHGPPSVTLVGEPMPDNWRRELQQYPRSLIITTKPATESLDEALDTLGLDEIPPLWRNRTQEDNQPTLYACRGRTCGPPVTDIDAAIEWLT